ncbi:DUF871 domain-containing protein [Robertmurraya andreesenii]|uniref:DUF871 domain-containing protein n=1 Tax=Anoxybacillus andreesenii TaxID=1325932 RepID=A0ABT9V5R4_9BACL|nr:MupG family TIM beta-alpha barrel fold protein [Robertmurraya andreesenii]MDQ0156288.1 hypothetical protein [Robertmurraya andreesenii]
MLGFSIFLNEDWSQEKESYVNQMADIGFEGVFTSLHIPEDDVSKYNERLTSLLEIVRARNLRLMIDISGDALKNIGLSLDEPQAIFESGISGLRADDGIDFKTIANLSQYLTVGLNASTLTESDYEQLIYHNANFSNLEVWHNYYPRPNTGLDEKWFYRKNDWLKSKRFKVCAFVPGDDNLRLPLYETLPTLEIHRSGHPLSSALSLTRDYLVDDVYVGDPGISDATCQQFNEFLQRKILLLHASSINKKWDSYIFKDHQNRLDVSRDVIRSEQSRIIHKQNDIQPENNIARRKGSITIDNHLYLRYKGELQIVKRELPADAKVNVIGQVIDKDLPLLDFIEDGTKFIIAAIKEAHHESK